jgi:CTD kinase subunit beta
MIPAPSQVGSSSTSGSSLSQASLVKRHRAYFTQNEIAYMTEKQRGKLTAKAEDKQRQTACAFAESVGGRLGL